MRNLFGTLTSRVVLVTVATAVVAVIVTALDAVPVAVRSVNNQIRAELVEKSALAVELLATERQPARERIVQQLRQDGIAVYLIRRGRIDHAGVPPRVVQQVAGGAVVNTRGLVNGRPSFIAGRPLSGVDSGVVLTKPAASGTAAKVLGGVWLRLIADLLVLSRLEAADIPLDIVAVDLVDLVRSAAEAWAPRCIPDGPRLLVELAPAPVVVETDPG